MNRTAGEGNIQHKRKHQERNTQHTGQQSAPQAATFSTTYVIICHTRPHLTATFSARQQHKAVTFSKGEQQSGTVSNRGSIREQHSASERNIQYQVEHKRGTYSTREQLPSPGRAVRVTFGMRDQL